MVQRLYAFTVVLVALLYGTVGAEAKVPIPCTSEKIVKVAALPKTADFALPNGQHIDLGYLYTGCVSGKWIGYVGSSSRYMTWKDDMLPDIAAAAGMKALPDAPGLVWGLINAPGAFWVEWMYALVLGLLAVFKGSSALVRANASPGARPVTAETEAAPTAAAASARIAPASTPLPQRTARLAPTVSPNRPARIAEGGTARAAPRNAAPSFGRRG